MITVAIDSVQASRRNPTRTQREQRPTRKPQPGGVRTIRWTSQSDLAGRLSALLTCATPRTSRVNSEDSNGAAERSAVRGKDGANSASRFAFSNKSCSGQ